MQHFLKLLAAIIVITYSLRLVNAQNDLLVFSGLGIILLSMYLLLRELDQLFDLFKSKL